MTSEKRKKSFSLEYVNPGFGLSFVLAESICYPLLLLNIINIIQDVCLFHCHNLTLFKVYSWGKLTSLKFHFRIEVPYR